MRVSDFGEIIVISDPDDAKPDLLIGPPGTNSSPRLIEAILRGETTIGGLAEAGWRFIGTFGDATLSAHQEETCR